MHLPPTHASEEHTLSLVLSDLYYPRILTTLREFHHHPTNFLQDSEQVTFFWAWFPHLQCEEVGQSYIYKLSRPTTQGSFTNNLLPVEILENLQNT